MKGLLVDSRIFFTLIFFSLLILLLDSLGLLYFPKYLSQQLVVPIQYGVYQTGISLARQFEFVIIIRRAARENKALRGQLAELLVENASLRKVLEENQIFQDQNLSLKIDTYNLLPAKVIGNSRYLSINKGISDGVEVGQAVVLKDNYIGQVKKVTPKTAEVVLSSDPDSKIAVYSQGGLGRARGILQGQFGSEALMDKILHQETIGVGDLVYSEGTEGKLPKGLILGKVSEVYARENEIFKQAKVEPLIEVLDLNLVFVIRSP